MIQSSSALMIKLAIILFNNYKLALSAPANVVLTVHDQILLEVDDRQSFIDENKKLLNDCMMASAYTILNKVPMVIDIKCGKVWEK